MGRLIDANKLIIHLADYQLSVAPYDGDSTEYHTIQNCIEAVQDQPTAYDLDKVVAELEKERHPEICGGWESMRIDRAIDIVKRGGRDD